MAAEAPRVLVNCAACTVGGGIQVAVGFVRHLLASPGLPFAPVLALSPQVAAACGAEAAARFPCWVADGRPGAVFSGRRVRRELPRLADRQRVRAVFTILGPSYARFRQPELTGFADGFAFADGGDCYARHPWPDRVRARILKALKRRFLRGSRAYWVEAESAKEGLVRMLGVRPSDVAVIPNAVNLAIRDGATGAPPEEPPMFLLLAAGYWHKNHQIAPPMARALESLLPGRDFHIAMTLPPGPVWDAVQADACALGVARRIRNLGPLSIDACARAIEASRAVLHPSLLETFSATYLEAMALGRPLLASDRPFARDVCGDAALYFDPLDPLSAARQAARILAEPGLADSLAGSGRRRMAAFPSPEEKNARLVELVATFAQQHG